MHNIRAPNSDPFVHLTLLLKKQNKFLNLTGNENRKVLKSTGRLLFFFFKFNYGTKLKQNKRKEVKQKKKKQTPETCKYRSHHQTKPCIDRQVSSQGFWNETQRLS